MEVCYNRIFIKNKVYFVESGIWGRLEFSSSSFSKTDCVSRRSSLEIVTKAMLMIINKVAITAVNLVRKLPTDLVEAKLSCETPRPKAPPSDFCSKMTATNTTAKIMLITISKFSIMTIYSNSLLYQ